jgi:catechol 2,3-dioxygenase-like lactoylglutathione lyase family enzyme
MSPFSRYTLHHIGIVLPDLEDAAFFMETMGLEEDYRGYVEPWSCWCIFTRGASGAAIELVTPEGGPLARFNKGAGGVHHFALEVPSFDEVNAWCATQGLTMLEPEPIKGAGNFLCNFLNPVSTRGVQIEFVQPLD